MSSLAHLLVQSMFKSQNNLLLFVIHVFRSQTKSLSQIVFDQQINIYLVGSLFLTDKEDKINLKEETPSRTSRIRLRKEMNMILTLPLTKEIEEDDASQIYYMVYFSFNFHFVCLIVKSILISASHLNSLWQLCVVVGIRFIFSGLSLCSSYCL